jgi:16S rRNA (cytidine1402-2'-O)-methyltransferase
MGTLYVVDMGAWEDVTLRARRVLGKVAFVAVRAERAAGVGAWLAAGGIDTPLLDVGARSGVLDALDKGDVAWLSPGVTRWDKEDEAFLHALLARGADVEVVSIPGGSALIAHLVCSGLPTQRFSYLGTLPPSAPARRELLRRVRHERYTLAFTVQVQDLGAVLGDVEAAVGVVRQMALFGAGEPWRGSVGDAQTWWTSAERESSSPGGGLAPHCFLFVGGADQDPVWAKDQVRQELCALLADGESTRDAARIVAQRSGWRRRAVYRLAVEIGERAGS